MTASVVDPSQREDTAKRFEVARSLLLTVADGCLGAGVLVFVEVLGFLVLCRAELSGPWEARQAVVFLCPLAWLANLPYAILGGIGLWLSDRGRASRALLALGAGAFAAWVVWSITTGRHFASMPLRLGSMLAVSAVAAGLSWLLSPRIGATSRMAPAKAGLIAAAGALALEVVNLTVLPRLYLGFHSALAILTAAQAPLLALGLRPLRVSPREVKVRFLVAVAVFAGLVARARMSADRLALGDNLRRMATERGPLAAQGIALATRLSPPPPLEASDEELTTSAPGRSNYGRDIQNWRGQNLLLITVDAVRADHVSAYGYPRRTTPAIDALAATGVLFEHAYCPTPHTSYSVVSLMTGKNMRPLLLQGLGADSDTWAGLLRRYGYRTAAFYPPAVFFIDAERFAGFRDNRLDFEFARIEFADPNERMGAVARYLDGANRDKPVFLWVHLFEPHEPYVAHPDYPFGDRDIDRYDSEIAFADAGIGAIVRRVREARPNTVVIIASDHGEEFADHGGHYHGTTVYEEQVRVPLIMQAPGLLPARRIPAPVQTIDLLPTVLSLLDIPRPARVRGRSLVPLLAAAQATHEGSALPQQGSSAPPQQGSSALPQQGSALPQQGSAPPQQGSADDASRRGEAQAFAFSETDEQTMLARGTERLLCLRRASACALYDLATDPGERHDLGTERPDRFQHMKQELRKFEASHGRFESLGLTREGGVFPAALRRGIAGDGDAAQDVAPLLDDADLRVRRKAAEVLFDLARSEAVPALRLARARDEDEIVRKWCVAALARSSANAEDWQKAADLLSETSPELRRAGALVLAEHGDSRGASQLLAWLESGGARFERARQIVAALGRSRATSAIPVLTNLLSDVRLGAEAAGALAAIGQSSVRPALLDQLGKERYQNARVALSRSLVRLGAKRELAPPLVRWLGTPDPLPSGLAIALEAGILGQVGGPAEVDWRRFRTAVDPSATVLPIHVPSGGNGAGCRVIVRGASVGGSGDGSGSASGTVTIEEVSRQAGHPEAGAGVTVTIAGPVDETQERAEPWPSSTSTECAGRVVNVRVRAKGLRVDAFALVPLDDELPPPPPQPWTPEENRAD